MGNSLSVDFGCVECNYFSKMSGNLTIDLKDMLNDEVEYTYDYKPNDTFSDLKDTIKEEDTLTDETAREIKFFYNKVLQLHENLTVQEVVQKYDGDIYISLPHYADDVANVHVEGQDFMIYRGRSRLGKHKVVNLEDGDEVPIKFQPGKFAVVNRK